ncbi:hypothetical protein BDZ89DRAFT_1042889 [Hymenopellis radicata]|nr:hypothetical protein BDZ89DRAFT_1042889 [Hymenopellis radicata]
MRRPASKAASVKAASRAASVKPSNKRACIPRGQQEVCVARREQETIVQVTELAAVLPPVEETICRRARRGGRAWQRLLLLLRKSPRQDDEIYLGCSFSYHPHVVGDKLALNPSKLFYLAVDTWTVENQEKLACILDGGSRISPTTTFTHHRLGPQMESITSPLFSRHVHHKPSSRPELGRTTFIETSFFTQRNAGGLSMVRYCGGPLVEVYLPTRTIKQSGILFSVKIFSSVMSFYSTIGRQAVAEQVANAYVGWYTGQRLHARTLTSGHSPKSEEMRAEYHTVDAYLLPLLSERTEDWRLGCKMRTYHTNREAYRRKKRRSFGQKEAPDPLGQAATAEDTSKDG